MSLVEKIQNLCDLKGITLANLQKELGFSNGSIYRWNTNCPSGDKLQKVAEYFNVSIDELMGKSSSVDFAYLRVMKEAKEKGFSPKDLEKAMEFLEWSRNRDD